MKYGLISSVGTLIATGALFGLGVLANLLLVAFAALPFQWAWNAAVPPVLKLPAISYTEAFGLLVLWAILRAVKKGVKFSATFRGGL